jgi:hypothetical protein
MQSACSQLRLYPTTQHRCQPSKRAIDVPCQPSDTGVGFPGAISHPRDLHSEKAESSASTQLTNGTLRAPEV